MKKTDDTGRAPGGFVCRGIKTITRQCLLLRELIRDPGEMGTICPSSGALSGRMASSVPQSLFESGFFVELGAGTGPVTEALLKRGMPPGRLIVVEKSQKLAEALAERFPNVNVLCCDAGNLRDHLPEEHRILVVVSSLPFRSIPRDTGLRIMSAVEDILVPGGLYVQFTYALIGEMPLVPGSFVKLSSDVVLFNIPPAKVEVFKKPEAGASGSERGD